MSNISDRLNTLYLIETIDIESFAGALGVSRSSAYNYIKGRTQPSHEVLSNLLNQMPHINPTWLYEGVGPMERNGEMKPVSSKDTPSSESRSASARPLPPDRPRVLSASAYLDAGGPPGPAAGLDLIPDHLPPATRRAPFQRTVTLTIATDIRARAGHKDLIVLTDYTYEVELPEPLMSAILGFNPPPILGVIEIDGDSMKDIYADGTLALYDPNRREVNGGGNFIIQLDGSVMCKRLQRLAGGVVKVMSANRDADYEDELLIPSEDEDTDEIILTSNITGKSATLDVVGRVVWPRPDDTRAALNPHRRPAKTGPRLPTQMNERTQSYLNAVQQLIANGHLDQRNEAAFKAAHRKERVSQCHLRCCVESSSKGASVDTSV